MHAPQVLPAPLEVPPRAVQVAALGAMLVAVRVQSRAVSQARVGTLLHRPARVESPGIGSLHVPDRVVQQTTASRFPQVEFAAHEAIVLPSAVARQPALRRAFRACTTQLTYCPWLRHGDSTLPGRVCPAHGHAW